jgi:DNA-binding response OmpR family regulator
MAERAPAETPTTIALEIFRLEDDEHGAGPFQEECLVLEYRLEDMNGLELVRQMRARAIGAPAIMITTRPSPALRGDASDAGIHIVEKPLLENTLMDRIRSVAGNAA